MAVGEGLYLDAHTGQMKEARVNDIITPTDTDQNKAWLRKEIKHLDATLNNSIVMRRDHPSYGYLKTDIYAGLHRLEGLIYAWLILHGNKSMAGATSVLWTERNTIVSDFGIDLADLKVRVKNS